MQIKFAVNASAALQRQQVHADVRTRIGVGVGKLFYALLNLDNLVRNEQPLFGDVKVTVAQFFRINGGTTQLQGVTPDIRFPNTAVDGENRGESSFDNALPWAQVKAAAYAPAGDLKDLLPILVTQHEARVKQDRDFQDLKEDIAEFRLQRRKNQVSLNEAERRRERDAQEARLAAREARRVAGKSANDDVFGKEPAPAKDRSLRDDGLLPNERDLASDLAAEKARKNAKDVLLQEAVSVLGDQVGALKTSARLAARVKPGSPAMPD